MADEPKTERLQLLLPPKEFEQITEYRWRNRISSLTEAARQLIAKGLKAEASTPERESA